MLNFLQLAFTGNRAYTTLDKAMCRKRRYVEFFKFNYKRDDLRLADLKFELAQDFSNYCMLQHGVAEISIAKLFQFFKETIKRAMAKGWVDKNVFYSYKCKYKEKEPDWLTMDELMTIKNQDFKKENLNEIRDIFVFGSFTGLAYEEIRTLKQTDIVTIDGKKWISKTRRKTHNQEPVPLLPLPLQIMEKYASHTKCQITGRLLPVPTNQGYNRRLKDIAAQSGITTVQLRTHKARYFFANEVTYNQGVPLKTISKMLSHGLIKTTERYVRPNKRNIAESMAMVEEKLFTKEGELKIDMAGELADRLSPAAPSGALIIPMPARNQA